MSEPENGGNDLSRAHRVDPDGERENETSPEREGRAPLARGSTVGRYVVLERLGAGAMGVVYGAYDPELDRKVALKLLRPKGGNDVQPLRQARLVREAQAIAKLSHPNVVSIFDVGTHAAEVFLAMEYLSGGTLRHWTMVQKRDWRDVLRMFVEAGRGLASAHAEGLIHRDFKPDNVLLDRNGSPKVVDFGVVRLATDTAPENVSEFSGDDLNVDPGAAEGLTRSGALTGTPAYMAPEQFLGRPVDARTDQYAFCVALFEALYGERPFSGSTVVALAKAVIAGETRPIRDDSAVPGRILKIILRGLSVDPGDRYPGLLALLQALSVDPASRRRRRLAVATGAIAVVALAIGVERRIEKRQSEVDYHVSIKLAEGARALAESRALKQRLSDLRVESFSAFDRGKREDGERRWTDARDVSSSFDLALEHVQQALEAVLAIDSGHVDARRSLAEAVFERAALAEMEVRRDDLARHLRTLDAVDLSGEQRRRWQLPGSVAIETDPPGANVVVERFDVERSGRLVAKPFGSPGQSPIASLALPPGSYRLRIEKGDSGETLYPFVVKRGQSLVLDIPLPGKDETPEGFRYVPAGRFLYGDYDDEWRLSFLNAAPLHEREQDAFFIAVNETTFGDWIDYLSTLPPVERTVRSSASKAVQDTVALGRTDQGGWTLLVNISNRPLTATVGGKIAYPGRPAASAAQDWLKMPVVGVSPTDVKGYLLWLSQRVPGARLCDDSEWERAARGADERVYPAALIRLDPRDANVDATYGRIPGAYGPDEVGRHRESRSPFGLDDMAGNVWEIVTSDADASRFVIRGGGYYHAAMSSRSTNREPIEPETRNHMLGFRVCANWRSGTQKGGR